jgi:hypothetical protein
MRRALFGLSLILATLSVGCFPVPIKLESSPTTFDAKALDGVWYVVATNFPMWVGSTKQNPTFKYTLRPDNSEARELDDIVWWIDGGKSDTYVGIDEQDTGDPVHFTWRGSGKLFLFSSEWYLAKIADDGAWAIVFYPATIASADGVDIIARRPDLPAARIAEARAVIASDPLLRIKGAGVVELRRTDIHPR